MEWIFLVTALNRARVESRLLQVLDHHAVPLRSFASIRTGEETRIRFIAELDRPAATRTADLLRKLHDIQTVEHREQKVPFGAGHSEVEEPAVTLPR